MTDALLILSGGQDSVLSLFWGKKKFSSIQAVTFDYGQRHKIEIESAKVVAAKMQMPLTILPINTFSAIGGSALTSGLKVSYSLQENGLPNTFVPGRNLIFITFAAAFAYRMGVTNLITGVSQEDYSGYPDCREYTIKCLEVALFFGMEKDFQIHTPMMHIKKAEALTLYAKDNPDALDCLSISHTCYNGQFPPCGTCPSCIIRAKSFTEAGMIDPLLIKAQGGK